MFWHVPRGKVRKGAALLKAIHAQESRSAALAKAQDVTDKLKAMKLGAAAKLVEEKIGETLTNYDFPSQHWLRIRTNNPMERLPREARRHTKVVGTFPDGHSALVLIAMVRTPWSRLRWRNIRTSKCCS